MRRSISFALLAMLSLQAAEGKGSVQSWCLDRSQGIGQCHQVHGRLTAYNGNPTFRIWIVGSPRLLGVAGRSAQETESGAMLPLRVRTAFAGGAFETHVFADFQVCPLEQRRSGRMQRVCIADATRLRVVRLPD
jgi:hypothetical protein